MPKQKKNKQNKTNKYIYQSYTNYYYNNNPYIGNLFLPVLCACVVGVCVAGSRGLLKLSQVGRSWQAGKSWMVSEAGAGGYVFPRITVLQRPELCRYPGRRITPIPLTGNNRLWYNVYNERGRKLYNVTESQETGKNAPGKRFRVYPYKIPWSRQKRHTAHLHKIWEYKNPGTVRRIRTAENGIPIYTRRAFC